MLMLLLMHFCIDVFISENGCLALNADWMFLDAMRIIINLIITLLLCCYLFNLPNVLKSIDTSTVVFMFS